MLDCTIRLQIYEYYLKVPNFRGLFLMKLRDGKKELDNNFCGGDGVILGD
jgi:hypothetical protein